MSRSSSANDGWFTEAELAEEEAARSTEPARRALPPSDWVTSAELAAHFNISHTSVTRLTRIPGCPAVNIAAGTKKRVLRWPLAATKAWLEQRTQDDEARASGSSSERRVISPPPRAPRKVTIQEARELLRSGG